MENALAYFGRESMKRRKNFIRLAKDALAYFERASMRLKQN